MTASLPEIEAQTTTADSLASSSSAALSRWLAAAAAAAGVPCALLCGAAFGVRLPGATLVLLTTGAFACVRFPQMRLRLACAVGFGALLLTNPVFGLYEALMVAVLYSLRRRPWTFLGVAATFCLFVPKTLFFWHYHQPGYYNWLSEPHLALTFFAALFHWRQRRDGRLPDLRSADEPFAWGLLFWLPGHVANPMVFSARELWTAPGFEARESARALLRLAVKSGVMLLWMRAEEALSFAHL